MNTSQDAKQTEKSLQENSSFFLENVGSYSRQVYELDTYRHIRDFTDEALTGIDSLLDMGNGGVCDYDVSRARSITALDLFLDELPASHLLPPNVQPLQGSALDIPKAAGSYDGVLMAMLLHHLAGTTPLESLDNATRAIAEAHRVLRPGGRLVIIESCVPAWFYSIEKLLFPAACASAYKLTGHPATLQYPPQLLASIVSHRFGSAPEVRRIPCGRWILQFGKKFPSALTPATPYRFIIHKQ